MHILLTLILVSLLMDIFAASPAWRIVQTLLIPLMIGVLAVVLKALHHLDILPPGYAPTSVASDLKYRRARYGSIEVSYLWNLNGGGIIFAYEFSRLVRRKFGRVPHLCEFCSGPGFIGFHLLAEGLCDRLTLTDIRPESIAAVRATITQNGLENKVTAYVADGLEGVPVEERWDLVVANPPWRLHRKAGDIRVTDKDARAHRLFFRDIRRHLRPGGRILFIEGGEYTRPDRFHPMVEAHGLTIAETFPAARWSDLLRSGDEYPGLPWSLVFFLRLSMAVRRCYFLLIRPAEEPPSPRGEKGSNAASDTGRKYPSK